jgi:hypothetical protein
MAAMSDSTPIAGEQARESRGMRSTGVTWRELNSKKANRSAIVKRSQLLKIMPWFERSVAMTVLIIGYAGTFAAFNGGWDQPFNPMALIPTILLQSTCTVVQWIYQDDWSRSIWFLVAVLVDIGTNIKGYADLVYSPISTIIPLSNNAAVWITIGILAAIVAIIPEKILVEGK